jgi:hypothetical protein
MLQLLPSKFVLYRKHSGISGREFAGLSVSCCDDEDFVTTWRIT